MPAMADGDGAEPGEAENGHDLDFNAAAWCPANREYGLFYLMVIRQGIAEKYPEMHKMKPAEVANLKFVENRVLNINSQSSTRAKPSRREAEVVVEEDSEAISEGEPYEESDVVPWPGKRGSWWRVHSSLGEDLVIREGLSIASPELSRISPGDAVQQAGAPRMLRHGRARGCIRLPVKPRGWVTADATRAGGPMYLMSGTAPRWRVVYSSPNSREGDAIVRADLALDSAEVAVLWCGDVVEQAGPSETRGQGILRMPVTATIQRRSDADSEPAKENAPAAKTIGWVTLDATSAGGPVFFKPAPDLEKKSRRRRHV